MSGGSWDYLYSKVEDAACRLTESKCALRRAFGEHLELCARALHDIEWVDSSDYSAGVEHEAIKKALGESAEELQMDILLRDARCLIERLKVLGA